MDANSNYSCKPGVHIKKSRFLGHLVKRFVHCRHALQKTRDVIEKRPIVVLTKDKLIDDLALRMSCDIPRNALSPPVLGSFVNVESNQRCHVPRNRRISPTRTASLQRSKPDETTSKVLHRRIKHKNSSTSMSDVQDHFLDINENAGVEIYFPRNGLTSPYLEDRSRTTSSPICDVTNHAMSQVATETPFPELHKTIPLEASKKVTRSSPHPNVLSSSECKTVVPKSDLVNLKDLDNKNVPKLADSTDAGGIQNEPSATESDSSRRSEIRWPSRELIEEDKLMTSVLRLICPVVVVDRCLLSNDLSDDSKSRKQFDDGPKCPEGSPTTSFQEHSPHPNVLSSAECRTVVPKSNLVNLNDFDVKNALKLSAFMDAGAIHNKPSATESDCSQRSEIRRSCRELTEDQELITSVLDLKCPVVVVDRCLLSNDRSDDSENRGKFDDGPKCPEGSPKTSFQEPSHHPNVLSSAECKTMVPKSLTSTKESDSSQRSEIRRPCRELIEDDELMTSTFGSKFPVVVVEKCLWSNDRFDYSKSRRKLDDGPKCIGESHKTCYQKPTATTTLLRPKNNDVSQSVKKFTSQSFVDEPEATESGSTTRDSRHVRVSMNISNIVETEYESSDDELFKSLFHFESPTVALGEVSPVICSPKRCQYRKTLKKSSPTGMNEGSLYSSDDSSSISEDETRIGDESGNQVAVAASVKHSAASKSSTDVSQADRKLRNPRNTSPADTKLTENRKRNLRGCFVHLAPCTSASSKIVVGRRNNLLARSSQTRRFASRLEQRSLPAQNSPKKPTRTTSNKLPSRGHIVEIPPNTSTSSSSESKSQCNNKPQSFTDRDGLMSRRFQMAMKSVWNEFETTNSIHEPKQTTLDKSKFRDSWPSWSREQLSNFMKIQSRNSSMMPRYFSSTPNCSVDLQTVIEALSRP